MDKIQKPFDFRKPLNIFQKASEMKLPPSLPTEKHKTKRPLLSKKKRTQTHPLLQKHCMLVPSTKGIQSYIKPKDVTVYKKLYSATLIRDTYLNGRIKVRKLDSSLDTWFYITAVVSVFSLFFPPPLHSYGCLSRQLWLLPSLWWPGVGSSRLWVVCYWLKNSWNATSAPHFYQKKFAS